LLKRLSSLHWCKLELDVQLGINIAEIDARHVVNVADVVIVVNVQKTTAFWFDIVSLMAGNQRGGVRPGSGRKTNASKLLEAGFVASWFTHEFQETKWKSFLASDDERIALEATKYLTDRLYGKAKITVDAEHSGNLGLTLIHSVPQPKRLED
jgi:hypothetical protein